jgi:hypothetical protein
MKDPSTPAFTPPTEPAAPQYPRQGRSPSGWTLLLILALVAAGILLAVDPFGWLSIPPSPTLTKGEAGPASAKDPSSHSLNGSAQAGAAMVSQAPRNGSAHSSPARGWGQIGARATTPNNPAEPAIARGGAGLSDPLAGEPPNLGVAQREPPPPPEPPSLAGRVLDGEGNPLIGIAVQTQGDRFFGPLTPEARTEGTAFTGGNGQYAIAGLAEGEYQLSAEAPGYGRAETRARTGTADADLVLHAEKTLWVYGRVTSRGGKALQDARVTPNLSPAISVPTDAEGYYETVVRLRDVQSSFDIRFEHPLHVPQSRRLDESSWEPSTAVELNITLEPISQTTTVVGRLQSITGEAVAGETLILYSPSLMRRVEAMSGPDGDFRIAEVAIAPDYLVSVRPRGPYQDYTRRDLAIAGPTDLLIPLEPLESGPLFGRMTDVWGNPVPNFTLMLRSTSAASRTLAVTGNEQGEFAVADVPFGELMFQTYGFPFFRIIAVNRGPETEGEVPIVIDWGPYEVRGRVLDETGFPLAAPEVNLNWSQTQGRVNSTAMHRTTADAEGYFRFGRLGAGPHVISVNVPGYQTGRLDYNVGNQTREIVLQLQPEGR